MNRRVTWLLPVVVMVVWGSTGTAEPAEGEPGSTPPGSASNAGAIVTLEQAARAALAYHQPYLISQETVTQLVQQRRQAFSALLPELTFNADVTRRPDNVVTGAGFEATREQGLSFTLTQPLFAGGKGVSGLRSATAQLRAGEQAENQAREDLLLNVAQAYYRVLKASKQVELFEAEQKRLQEYRRAAEVRVRVGDATRTVLLRAQSELAGAAASLIRAKSDEAIARDELAKLTGLSADIDLETPPPPTAPSALSDALISDAHAQRPELLRSQLSERAALQNVRVARSELFPAISLELTYEERAQEPKSPFFVGEDQFALLRLSFPFFEGGLQVAKIREARSQWRAAVLDSQYVKETVETEVRTAQREVEALTGSVEQFAAKVQFAKENYDLISRQFAAGLSSNLDLLDANSTLLQGEQELATATFDRDLAVLQLYKSVGRLTSYLLNQ